MCTLYEEGGTGRRQEASSAKVLAAFLLGLEEEWKTGKVRPARLVRPTNLAPVILPDGRVEEMVWGFKVKVRGRSGRMLDQTVVNSREDKLDGRTWKQSFQERRCLIPACAYYEWTGDPGSKQAHRFTRPDLGWMWLAGIWAETPERGRFFSMITTEPNRVAAFVHDRMPAVLREEELEPFLRGEMRHFKPAEDTLQAEAVVSPLSKLKVEKAPEPEGGQGELF